MDLNDYPVDVRKYISELLRRNVISNDALTDKTFINYLYTQKFDEDYIRSLSNDRYPLRKDRRTLGGNG